MGLVAYTLCPLYTRLNLLNEWTLLHLRTKFRDRKEKSRFVNLSFFRGKSLILEETPRPLPGNNRWRMVEREKWSLRIGGTGQLQWGFWRGTGDVAIGRLARRALSRTSGFLCLKECMQPSGPGAKLSSPRAGVLKISKQMNKRKAVMQMGTHHKVGENWLPGLKNAACLPAS